MRRIVSLLLCLAAFVAASSSDGDADEIVTSRNHHQKNSHPHDADEAPHSTSSGEEGPSHLDVDVADVSHAHDHSRHQSEASADLIAETTAAPQKDEKGTASSAPTPSDDLEAQIKQAYRKEYELLHPEWAAKVKKAAKKAARDAKRVGGTVKQPVSRGTAVKEMNCPAGTGLCNPEFQDSR